MLLSTTDYHAPQWSTGRLHTSYTPWISCSGCMIPYPLPYLLTTTPPHSR